MGREEKSIISRVLSRFLPVIFVVWSMGYFAKQKADFYEKAVEVFKTEIALKDAEIWKLKNRGCK